MDGIIEAKLIRNSVPEMLDDFKHPAAWFSKDPKWEPYNVAASNSSFLVPPPKPGDEMTLEEFSNIYGMGRISIERNSSMLTWEEYKLICGLSSKTIEEIEERAARIGSNVNNWLACLNLVESKYWLAIQYWDGEEWIDYDYLESEHLINPPSYKSTN